ncbi:glutamate carboxypeptidase [Collimonas sp. PA-H2]|uniref:M20/M25/M40 family metallo-hydrolase n=1 Tax=Collimonas sp. PA-H2 TaxID=1881062 RepID=UPI000BF87A58|nr:M20/M25/M40 family metallo-hydrolase [Collimonas sp. PA-H2]PFH08492.1 glutamate carboxypeptidase [Collimonas sp. PA-H2]
MFFLARSAFISSLGLGIVLGFTTPSSIAAPDKQVYETAEKYKGEALKLLERLVNIDSGTGDEQGLSQVGGIVIEELKKIGARVETYPAAPALGNNVVATFSGSGKGKILLMAHMDTVFKRGAAVAKPFYVKGNRAYGPGVMDDKGGVVAGLYALKILQELDFKDYAQITLLLNSNEETGSTGSRALIEKIAKQHDVVLNLEPGRPADGLVVWRKGSGTAQVEVIGKAAHAGVAPDSGRNAAMEAAHQILQLGQLGDREKQTTVNFTVINAGGSTNVIPDHATAFGDVRVAVPEEFDRVEKDMIKVSQKKLIPDTQVSTHLTRGFPPMPANPQSEALAAKAQAIYGELGKKLTLEGSGGAADSSLSAGVGIPTLDGFGIVGGGIHTPDEYAEIDSIVPRFYLLTRMLMDLGKPK